MQLKERVMDPRATDEISEALAYMETPEGGVPFRVVPAYIYHWYPTGLKERTVGPQSRQLVSMTRYYPTMTPRVVVDFEQDPKDIDFYEDTKRQFCHEQGIVYVPIYLLERMSVEQFKARYDAERDAMESGKRVRADDAALSQHDVEGWMMDGRLMTLMDRHTLQLITADEQATGKRYSGMARTHVLRRLKAKVLADVRGQLRSLRLTDPVAYMQEKVDQHGVDPSRQPDEPATTPAGRAD